MSTSQSRPRFVVRRTLFEMEHQSLSIASDRSGIEAIANAVVLRRVSTRAFPSPEEARAALERVRAIGRRQFPGTLGIRQASESRGQLVVVMEGTDGTTLADLAAQQGGAPRTFLAGLSSAALHLDGLHAQEIVHGDVRALTVFAAPDGSVSLTEFASLHAVLGWTRTQYAAPLGALEKLIPSWCLAPEVRAGQPASPRSDQYALAVAALEALGGRRLGPQDEPAALTSGSGFAPPGRNRVARVRRELQRALSPDPAQRFASCSEFAAAVEQRLRGAGRSRGALIAAAALVAFLLLLPAGKWLYARSERNRLDAAADGRRSSDLDGVRARYSVSLPPAARLAPEKAALAMDLVGTSAFDRWKQAIDDADEDARTRSRTAAFAAYVQRFAAAETVRLAAGKPDQTVAFLFTGRGDVPAAGDPRSAINWTATMSRMPDAAIGDLDLEVAVADESGETLASATATLKAGASASETVSIAVPAPVTGWDVGRSLTMVCRLKDPLTGSATAAGTPRPLKIGHYAWKSHEPKSLDAASARKAGAGIGTGIRLQTGDAFRVEAAGTIQPWSEGTYSLLGFSKREPIGPSGITPAGGSAGLDRFTMQLPDAPGPDKTRANLGALLLRVGEGLWMAPTLDPGVRTAGESGEILLSVNSIVRDSRSMNPKDLDRFWEADGEFRVTIHVRTVTFPAGTADAVKAIVGRRLDNRSQ